MLNLFLSSSFTVRLCQFSGKRNLWVRFSVLDLIVSINYSGLNKAKEIVVTTTATRRPTSTAGTVLSLSEPFMSLLLVLTHVEFKLDMEVRATYF